MPQNYYHNTLRRRGTRSEGIGNAKRAHMCGNAQKKRIFDFLDQPTSPVMAQHVLQSRDGKVFPRGRLLDRV